MTLFQDVMVDIETGGTLPDRAPIIQLAAVPFNLRELAIAPSAFCQSMHSPPTRAWSESTRDWWMDQKPEVLEDIIAKARPPGQVMDEFFKWSCDLGPNLRFWAKPTTFDFTFVASYLHDYEYPNPYHFRVARDLNSWIEARYFPDPVPDVEQTATGDAHNALNDCFMQIEKLFRHYAATRHVKDLVPA